MTKLALFIILALCVLPLAGASNTKTKPVPSCNGVPVSAGFCGFDKYGHWKYAPIKVK